MNRRGVELSINFIVVLILSLSALALGLMILSNIFEKGSELIAQLEPQTSAELDRMIAQGAVAAVYPTNVEGRRGKEVTFGVAVRNNGEAGGFRIQPITGIVVKNSGGGIPAGFISHFLDNPQQLEKGETAKFAALITVPPDAAAGTYIVDFTVVKDVETYDRVQKAYIHVR